MDAIIEIDMGEIAQMMLSGILCESCGASLDCDECQEIGIPAYCSNKCAKDRGALKEQVCKHPICDEKI